MTASRQCKYTSSPTEVTSGSSIGILEEKAKDIKVVFFEPSRVRSFQNKFVSTQRPSRHPDLTPRQSRLLHYFRMVVAERLTGYFNDRFWADQVFLVAQTVPSLRHAMIALSSHWQNVIVPRMGSRRLKDWECDQYALQEYTQAIVAMRASVENGRKTGRRGRKEMMELLMTNLLFIVLEIFQNHYESALTQISCGTHLYSEWRRTRELSAEDRTIDDEELEIQLGHVFRRLMLQSSLFPVTKVNHRFLLPEFTPKPLEMPMMFDNIVEARDCLNHCVATALHYQRKAPASIREDTKSTAALEEWSAAFDDYRIRNDRRLNAVEKRNCFILEMQQRGIELSILARTFQSEMVFDEYLPQFARIVALGRYVAESKKDTLTFGKILHHPKFDSAMILPLYLVASRCRDPMLRRQALDVLAVGPRQEGVWNGRILMSVAEKIIETEEGDRKVERCDDIPAHDRIMLMEAAILTTDKQVAAVFVKKARDIGREAEVFYKTIVYTE
jgi:hypothetical protein